LLSGGVPRHILFEKAERPNEHACERHFSEALRRHDTLLAPKWRLRILV
jgi:hypothetical protein